MRSPLGKNQDIVGESPTHMGGLPKPQGVRVAHRRGASRAVRVALNWICQKKKKAPTQGRRSAPTQGSVCVLAHRSAGTWPTCVAASRRTAALSPCHHSAP
jgi:hypothetical protein